MYLYEGKPGSGKTTIAMQFLLEGARLGERVLYIALSETERELKLVAKRHGWSLDGIDVFELVPPETVLDPSRELTVLHPAEMDLSETIKLVFDRVETMNPTRVVFDSLSELRLLAQSPLRYRRQVLALKHFFAQRDATIILLDDLSSQDNDLQLHSISHGVVLLEQLAIDYGAERRRLRVMKMRGIRFRGGFHDFTIQKGGLAIYPRLIAAEHHRAFVQDIASSGNEQLDHLLGGGLERGTNALLIGAAGVGKSSLALTYAIAATQRGEKAATSAMQSAVRARMRQYEVRALIEAREKAAIELEALIEARTAGLAAANAKLLQEISDREEFEVALRQAQKIEAIGQLTGGVAHDFNNLLMVISGGVGLLEKPQPDERRKRILDGMRNAAERGAGLSKQLLAFARRKPLTAEPVDLARRINGMRDLLDRTLRGDVHVETLVHLPDRAA